MDVVPFLNSAMLFSLACTKYVDFTLAFQLSGLNLPFACEKCFRYSF